MDINSFSVIMALVLFTVISAICSLFLYRTKSQHLWIIGFALVLCVLRCLIPVEFEGTYNVNVWNIYPEIFAFLKIKLFFGIRVMHLIFILTLLTGFVFLIKQVRIIICQVNFNRSLRLLPKNERITRIAAKAAEAVNCSADIDVFVANLFPTPIMTGFIHPVVLIPESTTEMTDLEIEYILRHEIAHYKGGDTWYKLAIQILVCLLWWNPAVYLLRLSVSQLLELRCDSRACHFLSSKERFDYSAVLLKSIRNTLNTPKKMISSGFVGNFDSLYTKQRIKVLMAPVVPKRSALATILIACICVLLYVGSYSFIVQPAYTPSDVENDSSMVTITPETAWLVPTDNGQYELWVNGAYVTTLPPEILVLSPYNELPIHKKEN